SYTHSNDLPGMVDQLAAAADRPLQIGVMAPAGWWWRDHAASEKTMEAIADGDWDFVVLQEQSMVPALSDMARQVSRPAAVKLAVAAIEAGARPVLFLTWGHRDGSAEVGHSSYSTMQAAIAKTYSEIGAAVAGEIAPVGMAWWMARDERPDLSLYQDDGIHPSKAGSYLAAAVITGTLLNVDANDLDRSLGLPEDTAAQLRSFASRAVNGEVPWR
ncbi:MAG: DUF4886 domain-containing protein, partial [Acidimicrobiia bacterium]